MFYFQGSKIHLKKLQIENVNIDRKIILEMIEVYYSPLCCLILKIVKHPVRIIAKLQNNKENKILSYRLPIDVLYTYNCWRLTTPLSTFLVIFIDIGNRRNGKQLSTCRKLITNFYYIK